MNDSTNNQIVKTKLIRVNDSISLSHNLSLGRKRGFGNRSSSTDHINSIIFVRRKKTAANTAGYENIENNNTFQQVPRELNISVLCDNLKESTILTLIPRRIASSKNLKVESIQKNEIVKTNKRRFFPEINTTKISNRFSFVFTNLFNYYTIFLATRFDLIKLNDNIKLFLTLIEMNIRPRKIFRSLFVGNTNNLENALNNIYKDSNGLWNHKFQASLPKVPTYHKCEQNNANYIKGKCKISIKNAKITEVRRNGILFKNYGNSFEEESFKSFFANPQLLVLYVVTENITLKQIQKPLKIMKEKIEKSCFICYDSLDKHSPDHNLDLFKSSINSEQKIQKIQISNSLILKTNVINKQPEIIGNLCQICFEDNTLEYFTKYYKCNHRVCDNCFISYLKNILRYYPLEIGCPIPKCPCKIYIFSLSELEGTLNINNCIFKALKRNDFSLKKRLFCPKCTASIKNELDRNKQDIRCPRCRQFICRKCFRFRHRKTTCEELNQKRYFKYLRCQNIQPCPSCFTPTMKCPNCYKMECPKCFLNFCYFCRGTYSKLHIPDFEKCLLKGSAGSGFESLFNINRSVFSICLIFLLFLILLIFSPFLAFIFPHIISKNVSSKYLRKVEDELFQYYFKPRSLQDNSKSFSADLLLSSYIILDQDWKSKLKADILYIMMFILSLTLYPFYILLTIICGFLLMIFSFYHLKSNLNP